MTIFDGPLAADYKHRSLLDPVAKTGRDSDGRRALFARLRRELASVFG